MPILLVRHGHAGSKAAWVGDDARRPLSEHGRDEAVALVGLLGAYAPVRILSSPLLRCLQTVEPLAIELGVAVEESALLVPDAGAAALGFVRSLHDQEGAVVVCTHGEVIQEVQVAFRDDGVPGVGRQRGRAKASTWVLELTDGKVTAARYLRPPLG